MYVGNIENAPWCLMEAPYERILRVMVSPELDPGQKDIAAGVVELSPGSKSDWRGHEEGELFFCVSGHGHIRVGEDCFKFEPYTAVYVPSNVPHQTYNDVGQEKMVIIWVLISPFGGDKAIIKRWNDMGRPPANQSTNL